MRRIRPARKRTPKSAEPIAIPAIAPGDKDEGAGYCVCAGGGVGGIVGVVIIVGLVKTGVELVVVVVIVLW